ncbi:YmiA family putative membrane protein [Erwinia typographi]
MKSIVSLQPTDIMSKSDVTNIRRGAWLIIFAGSGLSWCGLALMAWILHH